MIISPHVSEKLALVVARSLCPPSRIKMANKFGSQLHLLGHPVCQYQYAKAPNDEYAQRRRNKYDQGLECSLLHLPHYIFPRNYYHPDLEKVQSKL